MKTIIFYHGNCPDGFGGAYAAWKKFGNSVEYVALHRDTALPEDMAGNDLIFIDFCYEQPAMNQIMAEAKSVIVLDHHESVADVVRSVSNHVYDENRSGSSIAWNYFHPETPLPYLLKLIEQGDLYRPLSDDDHAAATYIYAQPQTFANWDALVARMENPEERVAIVERGQAYKEQFEFMVAQLAAAASVVSFEGYECSFVEAPKMFTTPVGVRLAKERPPLALIVHARPDGLRVSMRSIGDTNVMAIAQKFGGGGHFNAAAFSIPWGDPLPWKLVGKLNS